jgi:3-oxoacyl-(acyl-carrier-protein) synthase
MGDITSTRPASGAPIATAWGAEIHDAIEGIQSGTASIVFAGGSNASADLTVTFPRAYAAPPAVVASPQVTSTAYVANIKAVTATGFTLAMSHKDAGSNISAVTLPCHWIAIGTPA